jgi:vancomycin resistance protein YoaR
MTTAPTEQQDFADAVMDDPEMSWQDKAQWMHTAAVERLAERDAALADVRQLREIIDALRYSTIRYDSTRYVKITADAWSAFTHDAERMLDTPAESSSMSRLRSATVATAARDGVDA